MTIYAVSAPLPFWADLDGLPLDNGQIYFGQVGQNPVTHAVQAYWDAAGTQPAGQPVKVMNGTTVRNGAPAPVYIDGDYAVLAYDKRGRITISQASSIAVNTAAALETVLATLAGAGDVGFGFATNYAVNTIGWAIRVAGATVPVLKYIPIALWTTLAAGSETTDIGPYINQAIAEVAVTGGAAVLMPWTHCVSTPITTSARGITLDGVSPKEGTSISPSSGCCLKWTGATGATMVAFMAGAHNARVMNITFEANDKADTCLGFITNGGATPQTLHMPSAFNCGFSGYRAGAVVFGNPDTSVLDTGQMQVASLSHCKFMGGGATATVANVKGIVLNAQNCEWLMVSAIQFDPFTVPNSGPNCNHQSHIVVKTGGLQLRGAVMTRADGYGIDILTECGLIVDGVRTEDPLFLRMAPGFPSSPVTITNVQGRDGTSTGTEIFMQIAGGGGQTVVIDRIHSSGNIQILAANNVTLLVSGITYMHPGVSSVSTVGTPDPSAVFDVEDIRGQRTLINPNANEQWQNRAGTRLYGNVGGALFVQSLQGAGAGITGKNFAGASTVTATLATCTVTLPNAELDTNYHVLITVNAVTGAPGASASQVLKVDRTLTDFTVTFGGAAGAGNQITFGWMLFRF